MLTEIYIEALLVDEELADQVWEAWDAGEIDDRATPIVSRLPSIVGLLTDPVSISRFAHSGGRISTFRLIVLFTRKQKNSNR